MPVDRLASGERPVIPTEAAPVSPSLPFHIAQQIHESRAQQATAVASSDIAAAFLAKAEAARAELEANDTAVAQLPSADVRIFPDLMQTLHAQKTSVHGRVWLLLHHYGRANHHGRGWLTVEDAKRVIVDGWRIFKAQRFEQVINEGAGLLWSLEGGRVWLWGARQVANRFNHGRLTHRPVYVPIDRLTGKLGDYRASMWAAWHSGRKSETPISRATLTAETEMPQRTQRHYEAIAGVKRTFNYSFSTSDKDTADWRHLADLGGRYFMAKDTAGLFGPKGRALLAQQIPNSYEQIFAHQARSTRRNAINRTISDLRFNATRGTDADDKLYFDAEHPAPLSPARDVFTESTAYVQRELSGKSKRRRGRVTRGIWITTAGEVHHAR